MGHAHGFSRRDLDRLRHTWLNGWVNVPSTAPPKAGLGRAALVALGVWLITALSVADGGGEWVVVDQSRGITSSRREQPGCCLPSFRGQGRVSGNVLQVLALLLDVDAVPDWAYGINEAKLVKRIDARSELVYVYSDVTWPVRDRDMVVLREIEVLKPGEEFRIRLRCKPDARPERRGVVRVKSCLSTLHIRKAGPAHTDVDYVMNLDPGGALPDWVSGWVTKHVPFKTLVAIERSANKRKGQYEAVVKRWSTAM